jgi:dGTPase
LAFLVEAADNLCYHIIDLEDAARLGFVTYQEFEQLLSVILGPRFDPVKIAGYRTQLEKTAVLRALVINQLVDQCCTIFLDHEAEILEGRLDRDLFELLPERKNLEDIIALTIQRFYRRRTVLEIEAAGYEITAGLMQAFLPAALQVLQGKPDKRELSLFRLLPEYLQTIEKEGLSAYEVCRLCLDFIAGLSDNSAINLFRKIKGLNL